MKLTSILLLAISVFVLSCRPAAAPVAVSNRPVSTGVMPRAKVPMPPRKPPAEMMWTSMDGQSTQLGSLKGKVVILDFWATYCPPCRDEIPHLNDLQAKYGADNLQVIGLNVGGDEDRPKIPAFSKQYKIVYPIAVPEDELLSFVCGDDDRIPQTAVFDRNGQLVKKFVGFDASLKPELDAAVEVALASK